MHVKGLMNMQYAIEEGKVFVLEANPESIPYRAACFQGMQHPHGTACNRYYYL